VLCFGGIISPGLVPLVPEPVVASGEHREVAEPAKHSSPLLPPTRDCAAMGQETQKPPLDASSATTSGPTRCRRIFSAGMSAASIPNGLAADGGFMLEIVRRSTLELIKRPLRRLIDPFNAAVRKRALRGYVDALRTQPHADDVDPQLLHDVRRAWGNEAYSADLDFIARIAGRALQGKGPFLDCGSGISTIVVAALAGRHGSCVWSLEQNRAWYDYLRATLRALHITNVKLWYAPLRKYGDFVWFDLQGRRLPSGFSHVFCDGPAVFASDWEEPFFSSWRAGVVPVLEDAGIHFGEILLDDADDPRAEALRRRWECAGLATSVVQTATGPFILAKPRRFGSAAAPSASTEGSPPGHRPPR